MNRSRSCGLAHLDLRLAQQASTLQDGSQCWISDLGSYQCFDRIVAKHINTYAKENIPGKFLQECLTHGTVSAITLWFATQQES